MTTSSMHFMVVTVFYGASVYSIIASFWMMHLFIDHPWGASCCTVHLAKLGKQMMDGKRLFLPPSAQTTFSVRLFESISICKPKRLSLSTQNKPPLPCTNRPSWCLTLDREQTLQSGSSPCSFQLPLYVVIIIGSQLILNNIISVNQQTLQSLLYYAFLLRQSQLRDSM